MFNKIKSEGLRGLISGTLDLAPITLIYGRNSSGKSTVLRSIASLANAQLSARRSGALTWSKSGPWYAMAKVKPGERLLLSYSLPELDRERLELSPEDLTLAHYGVRVELSLKSDSVERDQRVTPALAVERLTCTILDEDERHLLISMRVEETSGVLQGSPDLIWWRDETNVELARFALAQRLIGEVPEDVLRLLPERQRWRYVEFLKEHDQEKLELDERVRHLRNKLAHLNDRDDDTLAAPFLKVLTELLEAFEQELIENYPALVSAVLRPWAQPFDLTGLIKGGVISHKEPPSSFTQQRDKRALELVRGAVERLSQPDLVGYLPAHRAVPRLVFLDRPGSHDAPLDETIRRLGAAQDAERLERLNEDLEALFGFKLACEPDASGEAYYCSLTRPSEPQEPSHSLADAGYGVSQALPLLEALGRLERQTLLVEEPEANLHPLAQVALLEIIVKRVMEAQGRASGGRRLMVALETHSEHIVERITQLIREKRLTDNDISILYVERRNGESQIKQTRTIDGFMTSSFHYLSYSDNPTKSRI